MPDRASLLRPGGLPRVHGHPAARAGAGYRRLSGGRRFAPSGDWDSGNQAFAISRGPPGRPPRTPGHDPPVSWHATVPLSSRIQVSHQAHGHLLRSAPATRAIQAVRLVAHPCHRCCPRPPPSRDQARHLQVRVHAAFRRPAGRAPRPAPASPARSARAITGTRPGVRHEIRVIERCVRPREAMQQSHLQGVLSNRELEASATPILPGQRAPFTLTRPKTPLFHRWIEA